MAAIARPNFLTLFPLVALAVLFLTNSLRLTPPRILNLPQAARALVIWAVAAIIPILPVTAANWLKGQEFVLIASQGGVNFWIGNNPEASGAISVLPGYGNTWTMEDAATEAAKELGHVPGPGELSRYYYAKGWDFISTEPAPATRFMIRKTLLFFNRFEISNNKHIAYFAALSPWLPALIWLNFGVLVPLGLLGAWVLWRVPQTKLLVGLILLYMVSVVLFFMAARFRMPTVPWFCLLAGGGASWLCEMLQVRAKARQFAPLLLLAGRGAGVYESVADPRGSRGLGAVHGRQRLFEVEPAGFGAGRVYRRDALRRRFGLGAAEPGGHRLAPGTERGSAAMVRIRRAQRQHQRRRVEQPRNRV